MSEEFQNRLAELGLSLPEAPAPAANYVPYVQSGSTLYVSGQLPFNEAGLITGKLGDDMDVEAGAEAAKSCALSLLAQVGAATGGDFSKVRAVKLTGFVNSTPDFSQQPAVVNGASDLMAALLGENGRHARSAVSAAALPFGVAVEVEGIFELT